MAWWKKAAAGSLLVVALGALAIYHLSSCSASPRSSIVDSDYPLPNAGPATNQAAPADSVTLTVKVTGLRNHNGDLIFGVFKAPDGFPYDKSKSLNWQVKAASADAVTFTCQLPPGKYSASVLHDENRNGHMDKNGVGVPVEGYGVTNNPKPQFRAATFDEANFTLGPQGATLDISLQYFL